MYWPSTSQNGEFIFKHQEGKWLNPDEVLNRYEDWHDLGSWPEASRCRKIIKRSADKQGKPGEKAGIVGAFCRTYSVPVAIDKFLSDTM